ncbi:MAG: hypothetical protein SFZ24_06110 [Planctomycetota bacterium]|nr:hypothetical protein [Planctomycetota bacterium]
MNRLTGSKGLLAATVLASCGVLGSPAAHAAKPEKPALSVIEDAKAHTEARIKAMNRVWDEVAAGRAEPAAVREALKKVAWARANFYKVRIAAFEALLRDEPNIEDTRKMMRLMLPTETQWNAIDFIGSTAADRGWTDLTTGLVRCWSRPVPEPPDDRRPERAALERLHPGRTPEDVVFDVFVGLPALGPAERTAADNRERERQDAWALLRRLDKDGTRTLALLSQAPLNETGDPLLASLAAAARDLGVVPDTAEQLAWVTSLRAPAYAQYWSQCASAVASLSPEQRRGLELRHMPAIRWASLARPQWLSTGRDELVAQLERELKPRKKVVRASAMNAARRAPESIQTWRDQLSWGDALLALAAAEAVLDPQLARDVFAQADEDKIDVSTEHGGVIDAPGAGGRPFSLRTFAPRPAQRFGDRRFVASPEMIEQGVDSLFHYHLHCTAYGNSEYAGPSDDDLLYARRQGRSCLVFTFTARDALNVDYFQPDGVVLDLGTIRRP